MPADITNLVPRSPIALGYTRGHFCALVPPEPDPGCGGGAGGGAAPPPAPQCCYLPLVGRDLSPLPLHFLSRCELGREEELLKQWLDVGLTESGRFILMLSILDAQCASKMNSVVLGPDHRGR